MFGNGYFGAYYGDPYYWPGTVGVAETVLSAGRLPQRIPLTIAPRRPRRPRVLELLLEPVETVYAIEIKASAALRVPVSAALAYALPMSVAESWRVPVSGATTYALPLELEGRTQVVTAEHRATIAATQGLLQRQEEETWLLLGKL